MYLIIHPDFAPVIADEFNPFTDWHEELLVVDLSVMMWFDGDMWHPVDSIKKIQTI